MNALLSALFVVLSLALVACVKERAPEPIAPARFAFAADGDLKPELDPQAKHSVRKRGNVWWASHGPHLYRSHTDTAGWYRVASLPVSHFELYPRNENEVIVTNGLGHNYEFRYDEQAMYTIPGLDSVPVTGIQQRGSTWIAFGSNYSRKSEGADPKSYSRSNRRTAIDGFVCASNDSGRTWWTADNWTDEGIEEAYLSTDGYVFLVSYSSRARTIVLRDRSTAVLVAAAPTGVATEAAAHREMYVTGNRIWLRTSYSYAASNDDLSFSDDLGRTWSSADSVVYLYSVTPFRNGFMAIHDNDVVYVDDDVDKKLIETNARARLSMAHQMTPVASDRILVEMQSDTVRDIWDRYWVEYRIP